MGAWGHGGSAWSPVATCTLVYLLVVLQAGGAEADNKYWFKATKLWQRNRGGGGEALGSSSKEYTMTGSVALQGGVSRGLGCLQCDRDGDCTSTGTWASSGEQLKAGSELKLTVYYDAWENDNGDRCDYSSGLFFAR
eukprot:TRINITY_DN11786_c0_g1_i1.p1 TRINITY_DN11786_c0_g1~~TRINITY_DN11786_c0_g1_i1.p1  ORF type:complete len:137 (+),score=10.99 TRINITY_DN11786_c0_g1_i1:125-535(+)